MKTRTGRSKRGCFFLLGAAGMAFLILGLGVTTLVRSPALAAQTMDVLRSVFGDRPVARLETTILGVQDSLQMWRYRAGLVKADAPWQPATPAAPTAVGSTPGSKVSGEVAAPTPASPQWNPPSAAPLGSLVGEGAWSPYLQGPTGQTLAYRTFLQPDPSRPYDVVGVIAFDTSQTRLHFVLGWSEPSIPGGPRGTGQVPAADKVPGVLLALFNGGFKARHGHFGAMQAGIQALPPRDGLGTIAIFKDGRLELGEWGTEITASPDLAAWRQNGPLVVHNGQINPRIYDNAPADWGYTVSSVAPTWRSGIGLSADGKTLYYLCGPGLSMEMLAKSMLAAGISNGMQLDINNYWVHFVAVRDKNNAVSLEPLFPAMMFEQIDRYLKGFSRDFFYVTVKE
jgi:hypothetical protein